MLDVSYAAAWELGRIMCLRDKNFSTGLFNWKRDYAHRLHEAQQRNRASHLQSATNSPDTGPNLPDNLKSWLEKLARLENVPFNYLVPEEPMLPEESIRFFKLDKTWVKSLLAGALSVGRTNSRDDFIYERIKDLILPFTKAGVDENIALDATLSPSGFFLRSDVVSGWPELIVEGYGSAPPELNTDIHKITPPIQRRLSKNTLLVLFTEEVHTVDIHLKPELLHFGFTRELESGAYVYKKKGLNVDFNAKNIVDLNQLKTVLGNPGNGALFAQRMIDRVDKIRFHRS